ncbi:MAG: AAA family ATPase [Planctomycetales bacterium]|nr:AAA family ATPase [Planctomycetales bacterium]MBN8625549.1 AAA family ATPase [Planctomycetota bacterium]
MPEGTSALFELELSLPDTRLSTLASRLVGFESRFSRMHQELLLLLDKDGLEQWSKKHYGVRVPLLETIFDRYPLVVFHGDVGTGKTVTAEVAANALAKQLHKDAMLFKLSTRVRGSGNVGEMSTLINQAFDVVAREAGRSKLSFLIIDEGDSLAANRNANQSHHEDKVAVNTLIQKIDDSRRFTGRVLVILCTNRFDAVDPAIVRRAAYIEEFRRPNDGERLEILRMDCEGLGLSSSVLDELVRLTGPGGQYQLGYTYSDIRTRLLPEALALAYPSRRVAREDLVAAVAKVIPSPSIHSAEK